jgi:hypothetical protein
MITAARQAGDLAEGGERNDLVVSDDKVATLADLGIGRDLAAHAVMLAEVPAGVPALPIPAGARLASGRSGANAARSIPRQGRAAPGPENQSDARYTPISYKCPRLS